MILSDLRAEPYTRRVTMFHHTTGARWRMPYLEWLMEECAEFAHAGKLDDWLTYYGRFEGLE